MKTRYSLVALLVVIGLLLAACGGAATPAPTQAPAVEPTTAPAVKPTTAPAATGPKGEITLWNAYGTGGAEEKALTEALAAMAKKYPDLKVNVLQIPFDQIFNKWETEVAAGGGPDMFTAPNDNTGNQIRAGLLADITELLKGRTDAFPPSSFDGATIDGKVYGVPGIIKAVALYYNTDTVPNPPKTTDELLDLVKSGKKIAINQNNYHNFGWLTGAFGGKLMSGDGTCIADQGGFAEALQFMKDLKAAGANFETDGGKADTAFRQGDVDMIINGPWMLGDYQKDLGDKLGVAPMPGGPAGAATPLAGVDYWYMNPNVSDEQKALAVDAALFLFGPEGAQIYADVAGSPMVAKGVKAQNPLVTAFAEAAAAGYPRPQSVEFGNWWGPFGDAVTKVMEGQLEPAAAVAEACAAMNKASGKTTEAPAEDLAGEITLWNAYGTGGAEEKALTEALAAMAKKYPDLKVNVLQIPFDQIFNKWETEVAAGGGPDMFTAPNDNTGNQIRAGLLADITELLKGRTDAFPPSSFDGATIDGKVYGVPGIIKAVALYYNTDTVPNPPKTTDELLDLVKSGKKIAINQNNYHNFGWLTGAFAGTLMDADGKCVADQTPGMAEALQFMKDLKAAGANFETDGGKADTAFRQGDVDMIINGPWMLGDYKKDLGDKLGVAPMPAGPGGAATPLAGVDYWYVNPNVTPEQQKLAVGAALFLFGPDGAQIYADVAGSPMVATGVSAKDPLVTAFAQAAASGFPRPQSVEFGNWWGPFGDAVTKVMEGQLEPADAVAEACAAMNKASGK